MRKDVIIEVIAKQTNELGETDIQEFAIEGKFYKKDAAYYILYDEPTVTGMEGTTTSLKAVPGQVSLNRMGKNQHKQVFELGICHRSCYITPYGPLSMSVIPSEVQVNLTDTGGSINLKYKLDLEDQKISDNTLSLYVREA